MKNLGSYSSILESGTEDVLKRYCDIREFTEKLCLPLADEDYVIQTMPDVSPTKWHIAHVSWFFETFLLNPFLPNYKEFHPQYSYIFNSYYNAVGDRHCRAKRGQLSRPTVSEIFAYRHYVDEAMTTLMKQTLDADKNNNNKSQLSFLIELGLHHEQQHQELMLMDIKHVFACSPLHPQYAEPQSSLDGDVPAMGWVDFAQGLQWIGHNGEGFAYDNEGPCHQALVYPFRLANRLVTNGEYIEFIKDKGYQHSELWLSDAWAVVQQHQWAAPLYWEEVDGQWFYFTLNGFIPVDQNAPVCHVSFYEADAYARWAGKRIPTEYEWETASEQQPIEGNFVDAKAFRPVALTSSTDNLNQMFGDVWEWTSSPYVGYPGYKAPQGAIGEYNGKFMCNQMVLRGGACVTSQSHMRKTYRNFFFPDNRWQFSGIRLAEDS